MCTLSCFSCGQLITILWTIARQAPLLMGFSRKEYWSELPCPPPGDLPDPGIKPTSLKPPALAGGFFTTSATWETPYLIRVGLKSNDWCLHERDERFRQRYRENSQVKLLQEGLMRTVFPKFYVYKSLCPLT